MKISLETEVEFYVRSRFGSIKLESTLEELEVTKEQLEQYQEDWEELKQEVLLPIYENWVWYDVIKEASINVVQSKDKVSSDGDGESDTS